MGTVYKAHDSHLYRSVAVKVLPQQAVADQKRKRRFIQEARSASTLNHPNILHIYDIDSADGLDFIAMEFVSGKDLDQLISARALPIHEAVTYGIQIADGLAAAHGAGIIHRDLKPANLMVNDKGLIKIVDFGLAKLLYHDAALDDPATESLIGTKPDDDSTKTIEPSPSLTEEGKIFGTPSYMSPEQVQGDPVDHRSDVFTFGSVLYEMTTGQRPFHRQSKFSTMMAVLQDEPRPPRDVSPAIPAELERIILRCLEKDRERRFQDMREVKTALIAVDAFLKTSDRLFSRATLSDRVTIQAIVVAGVLIVTSAISIVGWESGRKDSHSHRDAGVITDPVKPTQTVDLPKQWAPEKTRKEQSGTLAVTSSPSGATIFINGSEHPQRTPAMIQLPVGRYLVGLVKEGFPRDEGFIEIRAGRTATLNVELQRQ